MIRANVEIATTGAYSSRVLARHDERAHTILPQVLLSLFVLLVLSCGDSPTRPERHGTPQLLILCEPANVPLTTCRATVRCWLYPCAPGTPTDVTTVATWSTDNEHVIRVSGPGRLESTGPGDTLVRASWSQTGHWRPISVFPGTSPLPTYSIEGYIYEGTPTARVPLDGATVEVLNGVVSGRTALSGAPPALLPGVTPFTAPGLYRIPGVPDGTFRIRVTKEGYFEQDREVSGVQFTGAHFYLQRREP